MSHLRFFAALSFALFVAPGCGGDAQVQVDEDAGSDGSADTGALETGGGDSTPSDTTAGDSAKPDGAVGDGADGSSDGTSIDTSGETMADAPTDSGDASVDKDKLATELAKAICDREKACNDFAFKTAWADHATCVARHKLALLDRLGAPGTGDTATAFGLCAAAYPSFGCDKIAGNQVPGDCRPDGTVAKDAACVWHTQCVTGFCARASDDTCGVCAAKPKAGDSCATIDDCGRGLLCVLDKCVKLGSKGDACDVGGTLGAANPCEPGLGCKVVGTATTGTCDAALATGAECDYDEQCDEGNGFFCKDGATSTDPSTCALTPLHGVGESCVATTTIGPAECRGGTSCYDAATVGGKCIANAAEGAACNLTETSSGPDCTYPAVCDSATSKCTLPTSKTCL